MIKANGVTRFGLTFPSIKEVLIPIPPVNEQRKIAEILATWDQAIERVEKLIEAKQRLKKGLMQQLLTGQMRFPEFGDPVNKKGELPTGWKELKLSQFLHSTLRKVIKPKDGYLRLGIRSHGKGTFTALVKDSESIALTHLFQVRENDLIVNITFAWEGAIAVIRKEADGALVSHRFPTYTFNTSRVLPRFFKYFMVTDHFFYYLDLISPGGAGRNRVMNKGDFLKIEVILPVIEEQEKISGMLCALEEQIDFLIKYKELINQQKQGLMQKLLSGEIRVKV